MKQNLPTVFLGGGGYQPENAARLWTTLTAQIVGVKLPEEIPDDDDFFPFYGPSFEFEILKGRRKDFNSEHYLAQLDLELQSKLNFTVILYKCVNLSFIFR